MTDPKSSSLLARLNALRPSPVTLNPTTPSFHSAPDPATGKTITPVVADPEPEKDLVARFARLNGTSQIDPSPQHDVIEEDTEYSFENEPTLDELLQELQIDLSWQVSQSDKNDANDLVAEARLALSEATQIQERAQQEREREDGFRQAKGERGDAAEQSSQEDEPRQPTEDEEADAYIQQALEAAALEGSDDESEKHDAAHEDEGEDANTDAALSLPSAPTSLRPLPIYTQGNHDPAPLFELPSAPTFVPVTNPIKPQKLSSNVPAFPDDEIETWCIICSDDATLRCLGCEGDLYCGNCWNEGHRGPDAGYEEKMHKAVRFVKPSGKQRAQMGQGRKMVGAT